MKHTLYKIAYLCSWHFFDTRQPRLWLVSPAWFVGSFLRHCLPSSSPALSFVTSSSAFNVTAGCIGFPSAWRFVFGILCFLKHKLLLLSFFFLLLRSKVLREVENLKTSSISSTVFHRIECIDFKGMLFSKKLLNTRHCLLVILINNVFHSVSIYNKFIN